MSVPIGSARGNDSLQNARIAKLAASQAPMDIGEMIDQVCRLLQFNLNTAGVPAPASLIARDHQSLRRSYLNICIPPWEMVRVWGGVP